MHENYHWSAEERNSLLKGNKGMHQGEGGLKKWGFWTEKKLWSSWNTEFSFDQRGAPQWKP